MKLIKNHIIQKDGSGSAVLCPEEPEDMVRVHITLMIHRTDDPSSGMHTTSFDQEIYFEPVQSVESQHNSLRPEVHLQPVSTSI